MELLRLFILTCASRFLMPQNVCHTQAALSRQQTETESNKERERERGAERERNSVCVFVCMSRLSKGSKTVDITMIIRLISYISYMCMHENV